VGKIIYLQNNSWYRLGNINPDVMDFGKFKGCKFLNEGCKGGTFPEFCYNEEEVIFKFSHQKVKCSYS
jgi:hypothetical protein